MARLRLFAAAAEAAGVRADQVHAATVGEVLRAAEDRYGPAYAAVAAHCRVWCNGEPAEDGHPVGDDDEVAVLPPVSGG